MTHEEKIDLLLEIIAETRQNNDCLQLSVLLEEERKKSAYLESTLVHPNRIDEKNQEIEALKRKVAALEKQLGERDAMTEDTQKRPEANESTKQSKGNVRPRTEAQLRALADAREKRHQEKLAREAAKAAEAAKATEKEAGTSQAVFLSLEEGEEPTKHTMREAATILSNHFHISREDCRGIIGHCLDEFKRIQGITRETLEHNGKYAWVWNFQE